MRRRTASSAWRSSSAAPRVTWPPTVVAAAGRSTISASSRSPVRVSQHHLLRRVPRRRSGCRQRGRPPRRPAGAAARDRRRRLLGAERGEGDARRSSAHHGDRRRAGAADDVRRPSRRAGEPHRRLGHAVRHADRAPCRPRRVVRRSRSADLDGFYRDARVKFDASDEFKVRARNRVVLLQSDDPETMQLWRILVAQSTKHFNEVYRKLGVLLTDDDLAAESMYHPLLPRCARPTRGSRPARAERRRGRGRSRLGTPTVRVSRCRSSCASATVASTTPRATSPVCSTVSSGWARRCCSTSSARRSR